MEVRHTEAKKIPANWMRVSATKSVIRYHTPEVKQKIAERDRHTESLAIGKSGSTKTSPCLGFTNRARGGKGLARLSRGMQPALRYIPGRDE